MRPITLLALVFLFSCKHDAPRLHSYHAKLASLKKQQKREINFQCAIILSPNLKKIDKLKKSTPESDYNEIVSDNIYYIDQATTYLDSVKVKRINMYSNGVLNFRSVSGQTFKMQLDSINWGVILFNGKDKPVSADITDIGDEYKTYMSK